MIELSIGNGVSTISRGAAGRLAEAIGYELEPI